MKRHTVTTSIIAATALAGAPLLASCGSSTDGAGTAGAATNVTAITVGALPVADYGTLFYAKEKGLFKEAGLDVTVKTIQGGANSVPALLSGDFDVAVTNWTSYVQALGQKIPVRAVLPAAEGAPGVAGIVALPASGIAKPADLIGKTIAINNLKSVAELSARVSLKENGVDPAQVKFVAMPLPDMPAALAKKSVDAAWVVEPFLTATTSKGAKVVVDPFAGELKGMPIGGWSTTEKFAIANPQTLDKFAAAMTKATKALSDDKTFREFLPSFSGLPPALAANLHLPTPSARMDKDSLNQLVTIMKEYGWVKADVDVGGSLGHLRNGS